MAKILCIQWWDQKQSHKKKKELAYSRPAIRATCCILTLSGQKYKCCVPSPNIFVRTSFSAFWGKTRGSVSSAQGLLAEHQLWIEIAWSQFDGCCAGVAIHVDISVQMYLSREHSAVYRTNCVIWSSSWAQSIRRPNPILDCQSNNFFWNKLWLSDACKHSFDH